MTRKQTTTLAWICKIIASLIMLQTLYFKFTAAPESVYIFSALGMEPWGRIATGVLEALASILLLIPVTMIAGALLGLALMSGALFFHFTRLGIVVQDDSGQLFIYALLVWLSCLLLLIIRRPQLMRFFNRYKILKP